MVVKAIRAGLGRVIVCVDSLTRSKKKVRDEAVQQRVEQEAGKLALYQFHACPFCVKVRRAMHRLNVPIELRDAQKDSRHREALLAGGGRIKVPCLRIEEDGEVRWMYESSDIIAYLETRFS